MYWAAPRSERVGQVARGEIGIRRNVPVDARLARRPAVRPSPSLVDAVASGELESKGLERIFGTGKEAFRPSGNAEPYIRPTYGVRVVIHHDPNSDRGYLLRTAFPFNPAARR